jgi:hypothetical protein
VAFLLRARRGWGASGLKDVFTLKGVELAKGLMEVVVGDLVVFDVEAVERSLG